MRVTKAQAQANRAHIVETASALFREHGYDGIGVADLMAAAGFTHGGFYKHFRSKADLMAEAAGSGFSQTMQRASGADLTVFIENYLSRRHRDARGNGCTLAALCSDAARQPDAVKTSFAEGIERLLADLAKREDMSEGGGRAATLDTLAHLVGAIVLSRACPDESPLADEILAASRERLLGARAESRAS